MKNKKARRLLKPFNTSILIFTKYIKLGNGEIIMDFQFKTETGFR